MGWGAGLFLADLNESALKEAERLNIPRERLSTRYSDFLDQVDVVDVVTPTDLHYQICSEALRASKDVFVEKPMTMTSREAVELARLVEQRSRILQVGYYYRFHPIAQYIKKQIVDGAGLGNLRYLSGDFKGFKRASKRCRCHSYRRSSFH